MSLREWPRRAGAAAIIAGVLTLVYVGFVLAEAQLFQTTFRVSDAPPSRSVARSSFALPEGTGLGRLRIPRIGMDTAIAEGESGSVLRKGAGHLTDSSWLGEPGNIVLAGHRDTVFRSLREIEVGDVINLVSRDRHAWYEVASTAIVAPEDLSVLESSSSNTLTLITCYPFGFFGPAPDRFVVRAAEIR